jgi:hypothetical protein
METHVISTNLTPFQEVKRRINLTVEDFEKNKTKISKSHLGYCNIFEGCRMDLISEEDMKEVQKLLIYLCSTEDQRR